MKYIPAEKLKTWLENEADMEFKKTEENANSPVLCHFHNGCRMQALDTIDFIASLQQEQPSLPSNLDEAADHYEQTKATELACKYGWGEAAIRKQCFITGAEWMAGQGVTLEGRVCKDDYAEEAPFYYVETENSDDLPIVGEKVVVQIRKK